MILEVTKENSLFPLGMRFIFDREQELFIGVDQVDDASEDYAFHSRTQYSFAFPTLLRNEEIFTEVKIEEKNENNQISSGQEDTESKSEDVHTEEEQCDRIASLRANSVCEEVQREKVEEEIKEGEVIRGCVYQRRPYGRTEEDCEISRKEDKRASKLAVIDGALYDLITLLTQYRESRDALEIKTWDLRDAIQELREIL
jgi:hypothetical protein